MNPLLKLVKSRVPLTISLLVGLTQFAVAQTPSSKLNCDLSYKSIMELNKVDKIQWVQRWFATYNKPPAKRWIEDWKDESIASWVLIEHPNFHAAERTTLWLAKTKSRALYWESVQYDYHSNEQIEKRTIRKELRLDEYDKFFELASVWKQAEVLKPKVPVDNFNPEFWGFATIFSQGSCRQILLGIDDFMSCKTPECEKPLEIGKIMAALSPILLQEKTQVPR